MSDKHQIEPSDDILDDDEISEDEESDHKEIIRLRDSILENVHKDRKSIQSHIDELQGMLSDDSTRSISAIIENITASLRAKNDANSQLIKILDLDVKRTLKKSENTTSISLKDIMNDE